ncbi:RNA ligase family protein [Candidatus Parabeggiatoa sp. HSG14]|uniref:RNA ligase family protein n=1 Tax=Candidatus Parabeggiatoa sp. HSG14 TaxID=3055593 RepID=UPI0025A8CB4A|nr:RNA ligase family protein [Thiotrichales bacterium HSG14]
MAFFGVTKEIIASTFPIKDADVIEGATLEGSTFEFVIKKGQCQKGETVLYFPIDSLLPEWVLEKLGLVGRLSGKKKNRVKTVRLRGQISQGIVAELSLLEGMPTPEAEVDKEAETELITKFLGVEKYEAPIVPCTTANLVGLPIGLSSYDIEGADRYVEVAEVLMSQPVEITEKIEGQNFSVTYSALDDKIYVNQRNYSIQPIEGAVHDFWKVAESQGIIEFIQTTLKDSYPNKSITVYGEFIGPSVQCNIYKLKDFEVRLFDIKVNEEWLTPDVRQSIVEKHFGHINAHVPILATNVILEQWLDGKSMVEASHDVSQLRKTTREGIVIKPMVEARHQKIGRLLIKQRDPIYLSKTNN